MQPYRRLVQHIEHPCGTVAHRPGQLHPLPLPGRKRGRSAVQTQIPNTQIQQPHRSIQERLADPFGHRTHLLRQGSRHPAHPFHQFPQTHPARLVYGNAPDPRSAGSLGETRAPAVRTRPGLQEPLHPLHPLLVLDLRKGVLHGIDGIVVGKIQFPGLIGILRMVEYVLLLGRSVKDNIPLLRGQLVERHVRAHSHRPADIGHQGPHQGIPRQHRTLIDAQGLVRH